MKNRSFNVGCIVKCVVKIDRVFFFELLNAKSFNFFAVNAPRMGCKTYVLHNLIRDCHIDFLLKTQ